MAYGFKALRKLDGSSPVSVFEKRQLASANNPAAKNDIVLMSGVTGNVVFDTAGSKTTGVDIVGIAQYFEWADDNGDFHQSNYVGSSVASATVTVYCYFMPVEGVVFSVIADDDTAALAKTDETKAFAYIHAAPNSKRGLSGTMLDSNATATTATYPLRLEKILDKPGNAYGNTAGTVEVEVVFNCSSRNALGNTGGS